MTDVSEFEDAVEIMMDKGETKNCLDYIETEIDEDIVLNSCYLFDTKLNCLYELDRKLDAFREAKAYRADYLPLTPTVCTVLGNEYEKECNYTESYFYFSQFKFPDQDVTLSRLVKEMENEVKKKLDEEKYEEVVDYVNTINHDVVLSSEDLFDSKLKCLNLLNRKKELLKEAKTHLKAGGILSYYTSGILGSSYAELGNYGEARQHYIKAIQTCETQEEKLGYRNLLKLMETEEETRKIRKENKRVEKIDPSFLKGENKNFEQTKKKINPHKSIKEKDGSQLQCGVKNSQGDLNTEKEAKEIIAEEKGDLCGVSSPKKDVEKIEFSTLVKFSVVEHCSDIFDVIKEDHSTQSPMSLVKATENHLENLELLKSWSYDLPYMARVESALPSNSISLEPLLVVERIQPLHLFFSLERKKFITNSSSTSNKRDWWECIREKFRLIFRDIICGLFFLHSSNRVCSDFHDSLFVNKEGRGKILHNFSKKFSYVQAQQDVKDLVMLIEYVITGSTCQLVDSKDFRCHFENIKNSYNLPEELFSFLLYLNMHNENIALCKLPSTWLIDHPYFWDDGHRITFIKVLKDLIRYDKVSESAFDNWSQHKWSKTWNSQIKDDLLLAIHNYKKFSYREESTIVFYMYAVYSHINDLRYKKLRGDKKFNDDEVEVLLRSTFPEVYTFLFEVLCALSVANPTYYSDTIKKLSSCCAAKYDRMCLKESR